MIAKFLLSGDPVRSGRWLPLFVVAALVAPSPALTDGAAALAAPGALAAVGYTAGVRGRRIRTAQARSYQRRLQLPVVAGLLLIISSLADPGGDNIQRAIARAVTIFAIYNLALLYAKSPDDRTKILRSVLTGALITASIVIFASVTSTRFLGTELLPNRDFIFPVGLPKTTGLPRSFGELGLILAAGLATYHLARTRLTRLLALGVIASAFLVGQSRNMLLVLAAVGACLLLKNRVKNLSGIGGILGLVALFSPVVISLLISQGEVADQFVGEGIFARNVDARLNLLEEVEVVADRGWLFGRFFGATRAEWGTIASFAPHNHFISLLVFDGYVGLLYFFSVYISPILRVGRRADALRQPEFLFIAGGVVALSFYEGAFSASLAVALALIHGKSLAGPDKETSVDKPEPRKLEAAQPR